MRNAWHATPLVLTLTAVFGVCYVLNLQGTTWGDDEAVQEESTAETTRRLPDNFGKLALTDEQRETVYGIQSEYAERIDALLLQIEELRIERDQAMVAVLTPGQRLRLQELREEELRARAAESDEAPAATPENPNP